MSNRQAKKKKNTNSERRWGSENLNGDRMREKEKTH